MNSIAKNSSPLPKKTVENSRSSTLPSCSRTTPMNHKKAIPANGTRWRLNRMRLRRCASVWSASRLPSDKAMRIIVSAVMSSTAKMIPAIAADRRLRHRRAVSTGASVVTSLTSSDLRRRARGLSPRVVCPTAREGCHVMLARVDCLVTQRHEVISYGAL